MKHVKQGSLMGAILVSVLLFQMDFGVSVFAQSGSRSPKPRRVHVQATARGTSTQMGRMASVDITINEYSTAADQKALLEAFEQKGQEGLYNALDKMHAKGRMAITGTLGYDINYIRLFSMPDGTRRIRLITNRPIKFGEAWSNSRSSDYNLSAAEINIGQAKKKSTGTLFPAMELKLNKQEGLEIETFQNPWTLVNIMLR